MHRSDSAMRPIKSRHLHVKKARKANSCRMEFPTDINWASPFLFLGLLGDIYHFYSNFDR